MQSGFGSSDAGSLSDGLNKATATRHMQVRRLHAAVWATSRHVKLPWHSACRQRGACANPWLWVLHMGGLQAAHCSTQEELKEPCRLCETSDQETLPVDPVKAALLN